jgi:hypothetical protein
MQTVPLGATGSVTLDINGNGVIQLGPRFGQTWLPSAVSISSAGPIPTNGLVFSCTIAIGSNPSGATFVDATYQVLGAGSSLINGQSVCPGQYIYVTFANCNAGVIATATVNGTMTIAG